MDVFVTKNTLYAISGLLEIDYDTSSRARDSINHIVREYSTLHVLSDPEVESLVKLVSVNEILNTETPESIKNRIKSKQLTVEKRTRLVFIHNKKTYHYYDNCPKLVSDYQNFVIPNEIPENRIEDYRRFFLDNMSLFNEKPDVFYFKASVAFGVSIKNIEKMHYKNSGKAYTQDMLNILESENDPCSQSFSMALELYNNNKKTIQKFGRASHLRGEFLKANKMTRDEYIIIDEWHGAKERVKGDIFQKITKINKTSDHAYSSSILDALGFTPCSTCTELHKRQATVQQ
ncbi:hypothetical protein [Citrobacter sp. JGM124]|uniref:hypothetical protein n=1 Tax=Citrobacter sp. JGM124 TaxID=2799789 RepID=UPI001BAE33B3|nr:hypothetical protein [Citrobacter sp. JGM124]MBS0847927.1 hypothetical protein [Citrobacter sp. JGM124]